MVIPQVVSITSKGQATIPKEMRDKLGMKEKALVILTEDGVIFKPIPSPSDERGSLKSLIKDKNAKELIEDARKHEKSVR